jgi:hypothetical protein
MSPRTSLERLERRRLLASVTRNLNVWTISGSDAGEAITSTSADPTSASGWDHHAISYFPEQAVLALPNGSRTATQVLKVDVPSGRFGDLGRVQHDSFVSRSVRIGGNLFSIGVDAIRVHALADVGDAIDVLALPTP